MLADGNDRRPVSAAPGFEAMTPSSISAAVAMSAGATRVLERGTIGHRHHGDA